MLLQQLKEKEKEIQQLKKNPPVTAPRRRLDEELAKASEAQPSKPQQKDPKTLKP